MDDPLFEQAAGLIRRAADEPEPGERRRLVEEGLRLLRLAFDMAKAAATPTLDTPGAAES